MGFAQVARLSGIVSQIQDARDREALKDRVADGFRAFGFDNFIMGANARDKHELVLSPVLTAWPDHIIREYDRFNFVECDPILECFVSTRLAVAGTSNSYMPRIETASGRRYLEYLGSTPLAAGIVLPLPHARGRISGIAVSSSVRPSESFADIMPWISLIAKVAMMKAENLGLCADDSAAQLGDADLSARQIEILHWAALGKSNGDIAVILGQSKRAVDWHMSEILRKLKVTSRNQAVAFLSRARR